MAVIVASSGDYGFTAASFPPLALCQNLILSTISSRFDLPRGLIKFDNLNTFVITLHVYGTHEWCRFLRKR